MSYPIKEIEGIGPKFAEQLAEASIDSTADLLEHCGTPGGREAVSKSTGISTRTLLEWSNMADLMRIKGIGPEYAELLEAAGVDTVKELQHRQAENLVAKMEEVNAERKLTRQTPVVSMVTQWIASAKETPAAISF